MYNTLRLIFQSFFCIIYKEGSEYMKKGFTLIELLAVIVILAIIALIATPIILGIIKDAKENAFKSSIDGIVRTALTESVLNIKGEDILYKYENDNWTSNKLNIDRQIPKYIEIKVNKEGKVSYAITDGVYCATKEYNSELNIKKISNENNDKEMEELYCKLDAKIPTDDSCFVYSESNDKITITDYNCYKGNTKEYPEITDLIIPNEIDGTPVVNIGKSAFYGKYLTSLIIPNSVTSIGNQAFPNNAVTSEIGRASCRERV